MKAQGMPINIIIIAIISLVVLVVLIAIFGGRMSLWGQEVSRVDQNVCKSDKMQMVEGTSCASLGENYEVVYSNFRRCKESEAPTELGCYKPGFVCCVQR